MSKFAFPPSASETSGVNLGAGLLGGNMLGNLSKILELVNALGGISAVLPLVQDVLTAMSDWNKITAAANTISGLRARLEIVIRIAEKVSAVTPNAIDNQLVGFAKSAIATDAVLRLIILLMERSQSNGSNTGSGGSSGSPFDFIRSLKEIVPGL